MALAQTNFLVGDIAANVENILQVAKQARDQFGADLAVFPELTVTGYPAEDLLLRPDFVESANRAVGKIVSLLPKDIAVVIGFPEQEGGKLYNSAAVLCQGRVMASYRKRALPNYGVFDERRYFIAGDKPCVFEFKGTKIGLTICEDVWHPGIIEANKSEGADLLLTLNAPPFNAGKIQQREAVNGTQVRSAQIPLVYVNQIGGQDELIFDGASFVVDAQGEVVFRAEEFREQIGVVEFVDHKPVKGACAPLCKPISSEYQALVLGIRDYVRKNGFKGALLGLSGGIDSALVLALAVDALGADKVEAVLMPSRYTQAMSIEDAIWEADALGVKHQTIPIDPAVVAFPAGESAPVKVYVTIPADAPYGATDTVDVTLTSKGDPTQSATSSLTSAVWEHVHWLPSIQR